MKLSELAERLKCDFKGKDIEIIGVNSLNAAGESELSFLSNPKYISSLSQSKAGAIILKEEFANRVNPETSVLISVNPYEDFARCIFMYAKKQGFYKGVSPQAYIHESAKLGENCIVYPFVTIGENAVIGDNTELFSGVYIGENVTIGSRCTFYPNAVVMADTQIGNDCVFQAGSVIGGDGFGFIRVGDAIQKIPQIGKAVIQDKVEVGANSCVDRAALDKTQIGKGSCLDNLVQIGHNVNVGENNLIIAQVGIAGSTTTGKNVTLAAKAGIAGHLHIGANATVAPISGVGKDIPENAVVGGIPAVDQGTYMRTVTLMPKFPEMYKRLSALEKKVATNENN